MTPQDEIRKAIKLLYRAGDVVEVRAFDPAGVRRVGRYPVGWDLVRVIEREDQLGRSVYIVLNPTSLPPLPIASGQQGTRETDVPVRRHFLIDCDPVRQNKLATDQQHSLAVTQARLAKAFLEGEGFDNIILASSGNGAHLLVPVADLPNTPEVKEAIHRTQRVVAQKFSTRDVNIECFADSARLTRAYGTMNRKSPETEVLKWRRSKILQVGNSED